MATHPILLEAARLSRMGAAAYGDALAIRRQLRAEVTSRGVCLCQVEGTQVSGSLFIEAPSLDSAVSALGKELRNRKIKPGTGLLLFFASDGLKTVAMEIGQGKTYGKIQVLDSTARHDPARLKLQDVRRYCYRAIATGTGPAGGSNPSKAELLCLEVGPVEILRLDQKGVRGEKFAAPLLWVDFLLEHCSGDFESRTLLGIYDLGRAYFFSVRDGNVTGLRFLDRRAATDVKEIRDTGLNFGFDAGANGRGYKLVFACLTAESADVEETARETLELVQEVKVVRHEELFALEPRLQEFAEAPSLPLSLFALGQGGTLGAGATLAMPFYSAEEANRSQLKRLDLLMIRFLKMMRTGLFAGSVLLPLVTLFGYYRCVASPEWNVDAADLQKKDAEVLRLTGLESYVHKGLAICNGRIAPGSILAIAFAQLEPTFTLTKVSQATATDGYTIQISGTSPDDAIVAIEDYAHQLENRAGHQFPSYMAAARITRNDTDATAPAPGASGRRRSFEITLSLKRNP